ncbi:MAG: DEAD/DEAH box helicase family protein [Hydrogeniiclostridium mannosilyticum]
MISYKSLSVIRKRLRKRPCPMEGSHGHRRKIIFPRYHQLDVIRKLVRHTREHGPGHNYLISSAGSGKSNSIAWTAYRLASLHDDENRAIYNSVIIVTDRKVLDSQLQDTIDSFDHTLGSVVLIDERRAQRSAESSQ